MARTYRTKSEKRRALEALQAKSSKLFVSMVISTADYDKIGGIVSRGLKKLK